MIGRLRSWQRCQRDNPTFGGVVEGSKSTHHSSSNSDVIFIFHQNPVMEPVAGSEMRKKTKKCQVDFIPVFLSFPESFNKYQPLALICIYQR